jgi:hypothetical protein
MTARDLPIGGSTGHCHESTAAIDEAAAYLAAVAPEHCPRPLVPAMRAMFDLSPSQACQAIAEANRMRRG